MRRVRPVLPRPCRPWLTTQRPPVTAHPVAGGRLGVSSSLDVSSNRLSRGRQDAPVDRRMGENGAHDSTKTRSQGRPRSGAWLHPVGHGLRQGIYGQRGDRPPGWSARMHAGMNFGRCDGQRRPSPAHGQAWRRARSSPTCCGADFSEAYRFECSTRAPGLSRRPSPSAGRAVSGRYADEAARCAPGRLAAWN